jgi:hypothetical protein
MNTKIGTSFGLAMLMVIGVIAAMFATGMFTPKPASAAIGVVTTTVTPTTAKSTGQYTIVVTGAVGGAGIGAIPVGGTITVTFGTKFTVPSSIAASAVNIKSTVITGGTGTAGRLNSASSVTVDGRIVTITVPDMDSTAGTGDDGIAANAAVTITFTQSAAIVNPNVAQTARTTSSAASGTLKVYSSTDLTAATAIQSSLNAITSFTKFSPTTAARGADLTVTGGGFNTSCDDCKIRLNPQNAVAPTTGAGGVAFNGSGTIDSTGVFSGTVTLSSGTKAGGYVWITDKAGATQVSTTTFVQKAGATPRATTSKPGSTVTVDLVDYTATSAITNATITISGTALSNFVPAVTLPSSSATATNSSGATATLVPLKFPLPPSIGAGTHKVVITDAAGKAANFDVLVSLRSLAVIPASAVPGQSITISGDGYTKNGTIGIGDLTMKAGSVTTLAPVNAAAISIDSTGSFSYATRFPVLEATSGNGVSSTIVFTVTDDGPLVGVSDTAFKRTAKAITLSPTSITPGGALTVTVAGFSVDNGSVASTDSQFTVTLGTTNGGSEVTLTGTSVFPIGSDGTGTGTVTVPTTVSAATHYVTVTDNALTIGGGTATSNNTKTVSVSVPRGSVSVEPSSASTGNTVTLTGTNFPPNTTASTMTIGGANAMPSGGILTDANGGFVQIVEVPAATTGGSLSPGTQIVTTVVGNITGSSTSFSTPNPTIVITPAEAAVEDTIVITGAGFNSLGTVSTLNIGAASALPSPAPRASRNGTITATVIVPLLNPGSYTVTMTNGTNFTASSTFKATAATVVVASTADDTSTIFKDVIANDDNLVRVWRFSNADQSWQFYDPRPAFDAANTLVKTGAGDIVWVNVNIEELFQSDTLFPGWNLISLK